MKRFLILIITFSIVLIGNSQNKEDSDSLKKEFLNELLESKGDTKNALPLNPQDIEYKYIVKRKNPSGAGYYLEIKPPSPKMAEIKKNFGFQIDDRDMFVAYPNEQKIEILKELLSFCGDTTISSKRYKIREDGLGSIEIQPFTTQIEALYTFSRVLLLAYPQIKPKLTDKKGKKNYNGNQAKVDEVCEIYRQWLKDAINSEFKDLSLPMSGTKYQWEGQEKITSKWFINFHYEKNESEDI